MSVTYDGAEMFANNTDVDKKELLDYDIIDEVRIGGSLENYEEVKIE